MERYVFKWWLLCDLSTIYHDFQANVFDFQEGKLVMDLSVGAPKLKGNTK